MKLLSPRRSSLSRIAQRRALHPDLESRQRLQRQLLNALKVDDWKEAKRLVDRIFDVIAVSPAVAAEMAQRVPALEKMRRNLELGLGMVARGELQLAPPVPAQG